MENRKCKGTIIGTYDKQAIYWGHAFYCITTLEFFFLVLYCSSWFMLKIYSWIHCIGVKKVTSKWKRGVVEGNGRSQTRTRTMMGNAEEQSHGWLWGLRQGICAGFGKAPEGNGVTSLQNSISITIYLSKWTITFCSDFLIHSKAPGACKGRWFPSLIPILIHANVSQWSCDRAEESQRQIYICRD